MIWWSILQFFLFLQEKKGETRAIIVKKHEFKLFYLQIKMFPLKVNGRAQTTAWICYSYQWLRATYYNSSTQMLRLWCLKNLTKNSRWIFTIASPLLDRYVDEISRIFCNTFNFFHFKNNEKLDVTLAFF